MYCIGHVLTIQKIQLYLLDAPTTYILNGHHILFIFTLVMPLIQECPFIPYIVVQYVLNLHVLYRWYNKILFQLQKSYNQKTHDYEVPTASGSILSTWSAWNCWTVFGSNVSLYNYETESFTKTFHPTTMIFHIQF